MSNPLDNFTIDFPLNPADAMLISTGLSILKAKAEEDGEEMVGAAVDALAEKLTQIIQEKVPGVGKLAAKMEAEQRQREADEADIPPIPDFPEDFPWKDAG